MTQFRCSRTSKRVAELRNYEKEKDKIVDLHGLFVKEAVALVSLILFDLSSRAAKGTQFKIITVS